MLLTFDIEDWFHILDAQNSQTIKKWDDLESRFEPILDELLRLLDENNQKAIFFILGWLADRYPHIVTKILNAGHMIGSHSYSHQLVYEQSRAAFTADLIKSLNILSDQSGFKISMYRAPGFSIKQKNKWAFEVLCENGIEKDFSVFGVRRHHGGFSTDYDVSLPFKIRVGDKILEEYPLNIRKLFNVGFVYSGGGYFRLLNRFILRHFIRSDPYVMSYFHPRDFDYGQPRLEGLKLKDRIRYYVGLKSSFQKLQFISKEVLIEDPKVFFQNNSPKAIFNLEDL